MANKFEKKEWTDRQVQYSSRRKMIATGIENVYDVERVEGEVSEIGNAFDAVNMNDIESRVWNAFDNMDDTDIKITDTDEIFTETTLDGVLKELFISAANGKTAIASAIGGILSSSTFQVLANAITTGKTSVTTTLGSGTSSNTFAEITDIISTIKSNLASAIGGLTSTSTFANSINAITSGKAAIANAIGKTQGGTPTSSNTFGELANYISNYKKNYIVLTADIPAFVAANTISSVRINVSFGFVPTNIIVNRYMLTVYRNSSYMGSYLGGIVNHNRPTSLASYVDIGIDNITESGFDIWINSGGGYESSLYANPKNTVIAMG